MYMEIGQQAGLPLKGIAFPGHFLVKMRLGVNANLKLIQFL
jgi:regulator of sirC expression with transglutaminase-like and TPR domain